MQCRGHMLSFKSGSILHLRQMSDVWLQESVSRSGKWPQLPAIAEEPQAALQPALSNGRTAATRVAAQDLEAGLRAAMEAQRSLQARKRRRDKLLRAVSKVLLIFQSPSHGNTIAA